MYEICGFTKELVYCYNGKYNLPVCIYRDKDLVTIYHLIEKMLEHKKLLDTHQKNMLQQTMRYDWKKTENTECCHCGNASVKNHCHIAIRYRRFTHKKFSLNTKAPKMFQLFFVTPKVFVKQIDRGKGKNTVSHRFKKIRKEWQKESRTVLLIFLEYKQRGLSRRQIGQDLIFTTSCKSYAGYSENGIWENINRTKDKEILALSKTLSTIIKSG